MMRGKRFLTFILAIFMVMICVGCGSSNESASTVTVAQNDWAGGFERLSKVQTDVMSITEVLDTSNYEIIMGNPDDYWSNDDYHFLHFVPVYDDTMALTYFFNEQQDFSVVQENTTSLLSADTSTTYSNVSARKVDVNHYYLNFNTSILDWDKWYERNADFSVELIYDASHMWMQLVSTVTLDNKNYNNCFYEFAELDAGVYAIQNEQERLYVVYDDEGNLVEFYHSVLPDVTQSAAKEYIEYLNNADATDDEGNLIYTTAVQKPTYDADVDSIYLDMDIDGEDWVMERGEFKNTVTFKDDTLSVSVTNLLTNEVESFSVEVIEEIPEELLVEEEVPVEEELTAAEVMINTWESYTGTSITVFFTLSIFITIATIVLYILRSIGRYYVFDRMDASHPIFAWIPLLSMITLGFCASDEDDKIKVTKVTMPGALVALHPLVSVGITMVFSIGALVSPVFMIIGAVVSLVFTILCKGAIYTSVYTEIEDPENETKTAIGYLSGVFGIVATVKFLIYWRNNE